MVPIPAVETRQRRCYLRHLHKISVNRAVIQYCELKMCFDLVVKFNKVNTRANASLLFDDDVTMKPFEKKGPRGYSRKNLIHALRHA